MASLRLPCSPSTQRFSPNLHYQTFLKTPPSVSLHKSHQNKTCPFSFSFSLSHSPSLPTSKTTHFLLRFSASPTQTQSAPPHGGGELGDEFSRTRLIAQNVPWNCTAQDIRTLFEKFGNVVDVELSMHNKTRNRGLAFVTMGSSEEADTALKCLESYEFEGRTIRMNYAKVKKKKPSPPPVAPKQVPTFNLFVANLPFEARAKNLKEFFSSEGANVVSSEIIFHDNPRRSSGYGFVAFKTKKQADEALSTFQGKVFMGRPLRVDRSRQFVKQQSKESLQPDETSTELNSGVEQADSDDN